jgi:cysteine desulfurase
VAVYLDHAASGPMHPAARDAMVDWMEGGFGNPSGSHAVARRARLVVEEARDVVGRFLGVAPAGVVFTSGGTEADNLAVLGPLGTRPGAVVVSAVEHPAVLEAAAGSDREVRILAVDADGVVDTDHLKLLLDGEVAVVSVQTANHETGVVQPIARIAKIVHRRAPGAVMHTDAVQAAAWMDVAAFCAAADLVTISGHKIGGPQGIGALGVRDHVDIRARALGGGQEQERRSGTQNVAGIVGLAAAIRALDPARGELVGRLRDLLGRLVLDTCPEAVLTAPSAEKLPGHCHIRFPGAESEALLFLLDQKGICASAGAACASGAIEPSPVLLAMGVDKDGAGSSLRLTLGAGTTESDVRAAAAAIESAVSALRAGGRR